MRYRLFALLLFSACLALTPGHGFAAPFHSPLPAPGFTTWSAVPQRAVMAGPCAPGVAYDEACDVDHDGDVDIVDIELIAGHWGQSGAWNAGAGWTVVGNAGTTPGVNFIGTTDNQAFEIKVNGSRALYIAPTGGSPNLIGGFPSNAVSSNVVGATISGGGGATVPSANVVGDSFGVVVGGASNRAGNYDGDPANARYAAVGGGRANTSVAQGATTGGGDDNDATSNQAIVSGGIQNWASGARATVGGGYSNTASGANAAIGGGALHFSTGESSHIGGGADNSAGGQNGVVAGGLANEAGVANGSVGGGSGNWTLTGSNGTTPGGGNNQASGAYSFAAGTRAKATGTGAFVWSDTTGTDFVSAGNNSWRVRASGGSEFRANNASYGLHTDNDGAGRGLETYASTSEGNNWAALFASNSGSSPGLYANSGGAYASYFADPIFVNGGCTGCTLAVIAVNDGDGVLQPGDVVAATGTAGGAVDPSKCVVRVRLADAGSAFGVVLRAVPVATDEIAIAQLEDGEIRPGDNLLVVVQGLAQVRTSDGQELAPGQRLTVDVGGRARAVQDVEPRGLNTPIIGIILDRPDPATGLAPALVTATAN